MPSPNCDYPLPRASSRGWLFPMVELESLPNRLRSMAVGDRPQERLARLGAGALGDAELLAMLLRSGTRGHDVMTLATRLIGEAGSLTGLLAWREQDFRRQKGIGRVKALQLVAIVEVARRILMQEQGETPMLTHPAEIAAYMRPFTMGLEVERFWVLCLNRRNRLMRRIELSSGTPHSTLVHPREVFREAVREGASTIACVHNHPSGDPSPSGADLRVTRQLREAAHALEIPLMDHVIVGTVAHDPLGQGYYSFRETGVL